MIKFLSGQSGIFIPIDIYFQKAKCNHCFQYGLGVIWMLDSRLLKMFHCLQFYSFKYGLKINNLAFAFC